MVQKEQNINLPWVEKYRPGTLSDLISHEEIIKTINKFIQEDQVPHLLFYGPPGTGKTSTILACARQLYTPAQFPSMVLELNASDDRGIGIVRGPILTFASTRTIFKSGFKLIILDEADAMTLDAQNALRRIIEKYTDNIRCTRFRFGPLSPELILPRLTYICEQEQVKISDDGKQALLKLGNGDMRKTLNVLQSTWFAFKNVTEDTIYTCVGHPLRVDIENIVDWMLTEDVNVCFKNIQELKKLKGLALTDIVTEVHKFVHRIELPFKTLTTLLDKMADIEYRLSHGANEKIQLIGLISAFQFVRGSVGQQETC
ncbi:hypothetical protein GWI33_014368 [Rhynchophorus ferrugineus]|uniref:Activator 1 subunit 5 n=1 Tax=Rhynchophorus ferrugineus TaxID=354439 RepID=A0A834I7I5_RHYFE|nr:hypothetical protein GWI33_014368 [Rhynchophorus ferrugineus]